jgi:hypothetical protein
MSAQNCSIRSLMCLGTRRHGVTLAPRWVAEAGLEVGEAIGIDRGTGKYTERGATLYLGDYDPDVVDYERTLGECGDSVAVTLPPGIREWLDAELQESLYLMRTADGEDILVEAP